MTSTATITSQAFAALPTKLTEGTLPPGAPSTNGTKLDDLFSLAAQLEVAGHPIGQSVAKARTLRDAAQAAVHPDARRHIDAPDVLSLSPEQIATMARQTAAAALIAADTRSRSIATDAVDAALYDAVARAFRDDTTATIRAMGKDFDAAVAVLRKAARVGLTTASTREELVDTGTAEQIAAFRGIAAATSTLDRLASLRIRLCNVGGVGPAGHTIACLIAAPCGDLDSAANVYTGQTTRALVESEHPNAGPGVRTVPKARLGGPWLALIEAGYTPRLNTADEADALANA